MHLCILQAYYILHEIFCTLNVQNTNLILSALFYFSSTYRMIPNILSDIGIHDIIYFDSIIGKWKIMKVILIPKRLYSNCSSNLHINVTWYQYPLCVFCIIAILPSFGHRNRSSIAWVHQKPSAFSFEPLISFSVLSKSSEGRTCKNRLTPLDNRQDNNKIYYTLTHINTHFNSYPVRCRSKENDKPLFFIFIMIKYKGTVFSKMKLLFISTVILKQRKIKRTSSIWYEYNLIIQTNLQKHLVLMQNWYCMPQGNVIKVYAFFWLP